MKLDTLKKLYIEQLKDLYSAEKQLIKALPKMADFASNKKLKESFKKHLEETEGQVERLEKIFSDLEVSGNGKTCAAMKGLIKGGEELMEEDGDPAVLDAGLIAAAQRVEHYEMAAYGCIQEFAEILGEESAALCLKQTFAEEAKADEDLAELATSSVNPDASKAGSGEKSKRRSSDKSQFYKQGEPRPTDGSHQNFRV
ncbi:ferritin-like domain-containing protein [bacterium]|nr:ferritin-like domain-containing protein [bacterium]